jgi:uncharacterized YccA/Bax inhibitor family protein
MFSFLREADKENGSPGPLSMRRLAAALCLISAIGAAVFALIIIFKAVTANTSPTAIDWKIFIPMFIPCIAFLLSCIILLFFTTWEDIKGIVSAAVELKKK